MPQPNLIVLGAQKAGTTSIYDWLTQHPEIHGNQVFKDFNFFLNDEYSSKGNAWLSEQFTKKYNDERIVVHGFVNYLYDKEASKKLYEFDQDLKLLVVLRNPIERAYSAYWDAVKVGLESNTDFGKAIKNEKDILESGTQKEKYMMAYVDHGFYYKQLNEYYQLFNASQIMVILFDDIKRDKLKTMRSIFDFLNVDQDFVPNFILKNESGVPRFKGLQKFVQHAKVPSLVKNIIPASLLGALKLYIIRNLNVKKQAYPPMPDHIRKELIELYRDDIERLERLIDRDLSGWI